ncbi:MAG TPA: HAD-IB family phosphatase [Candidatus Paceibacterota bacterium]|nr:HAD-IB family phosphatase [Candidatus Paceibacterota bacterium]
MQKAAFFDIDGTLFRSSLLIELVEECIAAGIFPSDTRGRYADEFRAWQFREGTYEAYIDAVVDAFIENIRGVHYGAFVRVGEAVVERAGKKTYRYTRDLIADLKGKGYYLVAISQSPKTILDEFCAAYGFDKVYGRIYEIGPRDLFTGAITDVELIKDKSLIVKRVFERHELDREGSIGVGDTEGDIPLLSSVDTPICFNPNMQLYQHAKEKDWPIVVERKDVVYTI